MKLISIIMPSYNSEYVVFSIESIIAQTCSDFELLIVDDCSTDDTLIKIRPYLKDSRIRVIKLKRNSGAAVARNEGIKLSTGRYITFLDSDDLWLPNKLERQIDYMQENEIAFSYSAYDKIDESGNVVGHVGVPEKVTYNDLLKVCSIGCLTAIYDTHKLGKVYMPLIRKRQDLGLWLRILKEIPCAYAIPDVLAQYRVRSDSISANKRVAAQYTWKLYREVEQLNILKSIYYFSYYAVNGVLRTKLPRLARILGVLK